MNKQEIIEKIKKVVDTNSKKGKLTTTKFVGTYEYKSGYDTFIAVSYDKDKNLIVYSYYQNDRAEHIDTIIYNIEKLSEKELNEVLENLNTTSEEILDYVEWCHLEDKNQEIIAELGLYKPRKKKVVEYDIDSIPELENENDAYYVERNGHIGIMKFVAKESEKVYGRGAGIFYHKDNENEIEEFNCHSETVLFGYTEKQRKNDNLFFILSGYEEYSDDKYAFVKTKETLVNAINDSKNLGTVYLVGYKGGKMLKCDESKKMGIHSVPNDYMGFSDKKEAINFYNNLLDKTKVVAKELLRKYKTTLEKLNSIYKGSHYTYLAKHGIKVKDSKIGNYILVRDDYSLEVNVVKKDKNFAYLDDMTVLREDDRLMTKENFEEYEKLRNDKNNETISWKISDVKDAIEALNRLLSREHINGSKVFNACGFDIDRYEEKLKELSEKYNFDVL